MSSPSPQGRFQGKVALITGAASGIGRATAIKLSSQGAFLALTDINEAGLEETKELCRGEGGCLTLALDVSSSGACKRVVDEVVTFVEEVLVGNKKRLDFVFNCAGVNPTAFPLTETTDEYFEKLVGVNLKGTYNVTRACIPYMPPGSSFVNVSSTMGITAAPEYAIYCATKWAIVGFTKSLALELGPKQIRVNAVAPGYINTPTNAGVVAGPEAVKEQEGRIALGRMGTSEEVADVVAFLFSEESRYMTGSVVEITGGRA